MRAQPQNFDIRQSGSLCHLNGGVPACTDPGSLERSESGQWLSSLLSDPYFFFAALILAQRALWKSDSFFLAAALILRFALGFCTTAVSSFAAFRLAQISLSLAESLAFAALLIFRFFDTAGAAAAGVAVPRMKVSAFCSFSI